MSFAKNWFNKNDKDSELENDFYDIKKEDAIEEGGSKMILLEPRAYSETDQIANHLKKRNTVVVNLKRVTGEQAQRIMDFLSGVIFAIKGEIQKIGTGIYLCTPNNVNIQGKITDENEKDKKDKDDDNTNYEW